MNWTHPAPRGLVAITAQTVVTSSQAAAVPASLTCVIYEPSEIGGVRERGRDRRGDRGSRRSV